MSLPQNNAAERLRRILAERKGQANPLPAPEVPSTASGLVADQYQDEAVRLAASGQSFVLTGPAGSGKSTTVRRIIDALIDSGRAGVLANTHHKYIKDGTPGIVLTSFTNRAVDNTRAMLSADFSTNCVTLHKLLEFEPEYYLDSEGKTTMRFEPARTAGNPLPTSINVIIVEEGTLANVPLWNLVWAALAHRVQVIFIGDIQQLPPVFGKSIFVHAMQKGLPTVELKNVYRTADGSPILDLAHRILSGKIIPAAELPEWNITRDSGKIQIRQWPKPKTGTKLTDIQAIILMRGWLPQQIDSGAYNPERDMVLIPFNKGFGTTTLNATIASHLAKVKGAEVYEIFSGVGKKYFRIGERVIHNKKDAWILNIEPNKSYYGKSPRLPSTTMDYEGIEHDRNKLGVALTDEQLEKELDSVDRLFDDLADHTKDGESVARAASHIITIKYDDDGVETRLSATGEVTSLELGYCQTVHRAQGSERHKVLCFFHNSHDILIFRELLYTAITRAKHELVILCEPNTFVKGITNQRLAGKTLEEKLEKFDQWVERNQRGGQGNIDEIPVGLEELIARNAKILAQEG